MTDKPDDQFGPWSVNIEPAERLARLRSLRAMARLIAGPTGAILVDRLRQAETDIGVLPEALAALDALPTLPRRRLLASYAALDRKPRSS